MEGDQSVSDGNAQPPSVQDNARDSIAQRPTPRPRTRRIAVQSAELPTHQPRIMPRGNGQQGRSLVDRMNSPEFGVRALLTRLISQRIMDSLQAALSALEPDGETPFAEESESCWRSAYSGGDDRENQEPGGYPEDLFLYISEKEKEDFQCAIWYYFSSHPNIP